MHRTRLRGAIRPTDGDAPPSRSGRRQPDEADDLRHLIRRLLTVHERERQNLERGLQDEVGQILIGLNIRLLCLKQEARCRTTRIAGSAGLDAKGIERSITRMQGQVGYAVAIVHRYAAELRPALLDDLGLIPALQAHLKTMSTRTGIQTRLIAQAGVEQLDLAGRTVLFRVAQEALSNVCRHAKATRVAISITRHATGYRMVIHDDGGSCDVPRIMSARGGRRLGLIAMRERLAMVGGDFAMASAPRHGTTVTAQVPLHSHWAARTAPPAERNSR